MSILDAAGWPASVLVAIFAAGAVLGAAIAVRARRTATALGILFGLASLTGITIEVSGVGVRLEQPVAVVLAGYLLARHRAVLGKVIRQARLPVALGLVYLAANVAAAILFAPDAGQSLKISFWLGLSLLAAFVAAALVAASDPETVDRAVSRWFVGIACLLAIVAAAQVGAELAFGTDWGVLRSDVSVGKAFGLAWEPNLLAIQLAAALVFALDDGTTRSLTPPVRRGAIVTIAAGIALSLSRGGLVALAVGAAVAIAIRIRRSRGRLDGSVLRLARDATIAVAIALGGYAGISWLAGHGVGLRPGEVAAVPDAPDATLVPISSAAPSSPGPAATPSGGTAPSPRPSEPSPSTSASDPPRPSPSSPRYLGAGDTVELRLRNLQAAISDGLASPILGLGPDTFGQRYVEPTCSCPAHIPNQLSATFYESGLVGLGALLLLIGWALVTGIEQRADRFVVALVALLVGYQFTDALRFGLTWVLIGTIVGLVLLGREPVTRARAPSDTR